MLKTVGCLSNGLRSKPPQAFWKLSRRRIFPAHISTNTAINKSLRRSQHDYKRPERRGTYPLRSSTRGSAAARRPPWDKIGRIGTKKGVDVKAIRESEGINEMQRPQQRLRKELRRNENGEFDRSTRGAQYNYDSHPEGNRALRRARKFGHKLKPPASGQSELARRRTATYNASHGDKIYPSEKRLFEGTPSGRTPSHAATLRHGEKQEYGPPLSEELQDNTASSTYYQKPPFSYPRRLDRPDRSSYSSSPRGNYHPIDGYSEDRSQVNDQSSHRNSEVPLSIPYTTPASHFLYGTSVIIAALSSSRRKLYKLYIYSSENRDDVQQDNRIRELALQRGVVVERVKEDGLRLMYKMSQGRPHNGYVLEASPLPKLPVIGFESVERRNGAFHVILDHQSHEEEVVNGTSTNVEYEVGFRRYPFVLLLDGILDPGNLGAILRSAFFLGVDMVAMSNRSCAPISPVAIKASAGACETLPLASVSQRGTFIDKCKSNGWKIYAAAAPAPGKRIGLGNHLSSSNVGNLVRKHPCILLLGGEGEGLHWNLRRKADFEVGIDSPRIGQTDVDSLNVSVAAGILCDAFLRKPIERREFDTSAADNVETQTASSGDGAKFQQNRIF